MSDIQKKQEEIEQKIDEWRKEGRIIDVSNPRNGSALPIRIQHSGQPFHVYFDGQACKVALEDSNEPSSKFMWTQDDVVEKVLGCIDRLLKG